MLPAFMASGCCLDALSIFHSFPWSFGVTIGIVKAMVAEFGRVLATQKTCLDSPKASPIC
jgi:hypothetical protein